MEDWQKNHYLTRKGPKLEDYNAVTGFPSLHVWVWSRIMCWTFQICVIYIELSCPPKVDNHARMQITVNIQTDFLNIGRIWKRYVEHTETH